MSADGIPTAKGAPQFLGVGAPATAADLNTIAQWASDNIDRSVANFAALAGIVGKYVGMVVTTADTNQEWLCTNASGGGVWAGRGGVGTRRVLGEADRLASAAAFNPGIAFADVPGATVTCTTPNVTVRVICSLIVNNAGSGSDRTMNLQLLCDGALIGEVVANLYLNWTAGVPGGAQSVVIVAKHLATAGSHTYKLQALASSAAATAVNQVNLLIETSA